MSVPLINIKAYRCTGGAVVTVSRPGEQKRRFRVSLRRYHALRDWVITHGAGGAFLRSSMDAYIRHEHDFQPIPSAHLGFGCRCGAVPPMDWYPDQP